MPPEQPTSDSLYRAIGAVEKLMASEFRTVQVQLESLRREFGDGYKRLDERVSQLEERNDERESEARQFRRTRLPTLLLSGGSLLTAIGALIATVL